MKKKNKVINTYVPKMCLLRKITYGEFSEFVREKKVHIVYTHCTRFVFHLFKNLTVSTCYYDDLRENSELLLQLMGSEKFINFN